MSSFISNQNKVLLIGTVIAVISTCSCSHPKTGEHENLLPPIDVAKPVVKPVVVHKTYPGYIIANRDIKVVARVNGTVTRKAYKNGEYVRQGQVMFTIEDTEYRDRVKQCEAQLQTAIATNKYATQHYNAVKKALESDAVSKMEVVQAESAMQESEAAIKSAEAALRTARNTLGYCIIRAPGDGHVSTASINVGDYVSGENSPVVITTIYDDEVVVAQFAIEESQYIKMKDEANSKKMDYDNISVTFTDTLPHSYSGKLNYVAPDVDKSTGTVKLQISLDNPYGELKDGMFATINMPEEELSEAILIRDASIGTDQLGKYVFVVNDSNKVVYTPVKIGEIVNDTMRIINDGLTANSRYVTKALLKVRDGMEVKPVLEK